MRRLFLIPLIVILLSSVSMATSVRIVWPGNSDADGVVKYTIYMKADNVTGLGFVKGQDIVGTVAGNTPSYIIDNVSDSISYCIRLTASDSDGNESAFSPASYIKVDTTAPTQVGIPVLKLVGKKLVITWPSNAALDGVVKYKIYLRSDNTDGTGFEKGQDIIATVKANVRSYTYSLRYSSSYCVKITAVDAAGNESVFSNPAYIQY